MSLSDYVKYQRALLGGLTPWEIAEGSGVPAREVHLLEVKHRRMGEDDDVLQRLANYFGVPLKELTGRREAYRKRLSYFLEENNHEIVPISFKLESGEEVRGTLAWYSREAVALKPEEANHSDGESNNNDDTLCIVQRAWIADWRRGDTTQWEVVSSLASAGENAG